MRLGRTQIICCALTREDANRTKIIAREGCSLGCGCRSPKGKVVGNPPLSAPNCQGVSLLVVLCSSFSRCWRRSFVVRHHLHPILELRFALFVSGSPVVDGRHSQAVLGRLTFNHGRCSAAPVFVVGGRHSPVEAILTCIDGLCLLYMFK
jgi:hypothetical protein